MAAMHRIGVLAMTTTLALSPSYADTPRGYDAFTSRNGRFELRLMSPMSFKPQLWSLVERQTTGVRYSIQASLASQWVYVSDDGRHLGAVDYFPSGEASLSDQVLSFGSDWPYLELSSISTRGWASSPGGPTVIRSGRDDACKRRE